MIKYFAEIPYIS